MLEASLANNYAISSNGIVHDLLPIVNKERGNNVQRLACGYDVAFLAEGELRNHAAHCKNCQNEQQLQITTRCTGPIG